MALKVSLNAIVFQTLNDKYSGSKKKVKISTVFDVARSEVEEMVKEADSKGDGMVDYEGMEE